MNNSLSNMEFALFKKYIADKCGIEIADSKAYLIETRLYRILVDSKLNSFSELYNEILKSKDESLTEKIIDAISTNETLWFRDKTPWMILENLYMPKFIELLRSGRKSKIRIWSAAASTGQEAYSTAMCIDGYLLKNNINDIDLSRFEIIATDVSKNVLELASKGKYDAITITRGLDKTIKEKYFEKNGMAWEINEKIRNAVKFMQFNLQNSFMLLNKFDIIFCRYVLIYFPDILKQEVLKKCFRALYDDGAMFLGSYELHRHLESKFLMQTYENGVYYTKKTEAKEGLA